MSFISIGPINFKSFTRIVAQQFYLFRQFRCWCLRRKVPTLVMRWWTCLSLPFTSQARYPLAWPDDMFSLPLCKTGSLTSVVEVLSLPLTPIHSRSLHLAHPTLTLDVCITLDTFRHKPYVISIRRWLVTLHIKIQTPVSWGKGPQSLMALFENTVCCAKSSAEFILCCPDGFTLLVR